MVRGVPGEAAAVALWWWGMLWRPSCSPGQLGLHPGLNSQYTPGMVVHTLLGSQCCSPLNPFPACPRSFCVVWNGSLRHIVERLAAFEPATRNQR